MNRTDHTTNDGPSRASPSDGSGAPTLLLAVTSVLLAAVAVIAVVSQTSSLWVTGVGMGVIMAGLAIVLAVIGAQLRDEGDPAPARARDPEMGSRPHGDGGVR